MATLTVTASLLGSYSSKVVNMTARGIDDYHILHGLGATPHSVYFVLRSHPAASLPHHFVVGSYDATMVYLTGDNTPSAHGTADVVIERTHSIAL